MADMSREGILLLAKAYDFFAEKCQRHVDTALAEGKDASPFEAPVVEHKVVARALRLLAGEMGEPVAVKPLSWRVTGQDWYANSDVGEYAAGRVGANYSALLRRVDDNNLDDVRIKAGLATIDEAKAAAQADFETRIRSALVSPPARSEGVEARGGIYIASKTQHAARWRALRGAGTPIIATWIDEAGEGETSDFDDLWRRCILEPQHATVLIAYREPDELFKGGWVEIGAALAAGTPVYGVGLRGFTIGKSTLIRHFDSFDDAMAAAIRALAPKEG